MKTGERVNVVLDCVVQEVDGRLMARVFVRLVDTPHGEGGTQPPPVLPGGHRNVVGTWIGVPSDQTAVGAFGIDCGPAPARDTDPMPVFVIKGKDRLAPDAVAAYQNLCAEHGLRDQAQQVWFALGEIAGWQSRHPELVQMPVHKHVPATTTEGNPS